MSLHRFAGIILLFIGFCLEYISLTEISQTVHYSFMSGVLNFWSVHALGSIILSVAFYILSPVSLESIPKIGKFLVFFSITLLCPVLGGMVIVFSLLIYTHFYGTQEKEIKFILEDEIFEMDAHFDPARIEASTSIVSVLNQEDDDMRRNAALALKKCEPKFAIPILKRAMQDSDEEVRIYCLNIFNGYCDALEKSIRVLQNRRMKKGSNVDVLISIADKYAEQVFVGIFEDQVEEVFTLKKAQDCLEEALSLEEDNQDVLLRLLRIAIRTGSFDRAEYALNELEIRNFPSDLLVEWKAELAYWKNDWKGVRKLFGEVKDKESIDKNVLVLKEFWQYGCKF